MKINKQLKEFETRLAAFEAEQEAKDASWESRLQRQRELLKLSDEIYKAVSMAGNKASPKHMAKAFELRTRIFGLLEQQIDETTLSDPKAVRDQLKIIKELERDIESQKQQFRESSASKSVINKVQGYINEKLVFTSTLVVREQLEKTQDHLTHKHYLYLKARIKALEQEIKSVDFNNNDMLEEIKDLSFELRVLEKKSSISFPDAHDLQRHLYNYSVTIESRIQKADPEYLETAGNVNRVIQLNYMHSRLNFLAEKYEDILPGKTLVTQYEDNNREIGDLYVEILQIKSALPMKATLEAEKAALKDEIEGLRLQLIGLTNISSEELKAKNRNLHHSDQEIRRAEEIRQQEINSRVESLRLDISKKEKRIAAIGYTLDGYDVVANTIAEIEIKLDKCRQINVLTLLNEPEKSKKVLDLFLQYAKNNKVESATELMLNTASAGPMTTICKTYFPTSNQEDLWTLLNSEASRGLVLTALRPIWKKPEYKTKRGQIWANVLDKFSSDDNKFEAKLPEVWQNLLQIPKGPAERMGALSKFIEFINNPESSLSEIDQESLVRVAIATLLPTATQDELWLLMKSDIASKMLLEAYVKNKGSDHPFTQMWDKLLNGDGSPEAKHKGQQYLAEFLKEDKYAKDDKLIEKARTKLAELAVTVGDNTSNPREMFATVKQEIKHDPDKAARLFKQVLDSDEYKKNNKFNEEVTEYMATHQTLVQVYHQSHSTGGAFGVTPLSVAMQKTSQTASEKSDHSAKWKKYLREIGKTGIRPTVDEVPQSKPDSEKEKKEPEPQMCERHLSPGRR